MSESYLPFFAQWDSLREYCRALRRDGVALMSGGLGVILAFFAAYFEWVQRNGKVALWIAAAIAFFVASYRLWLKKHRELDAEKK